MNIDKFKPLTVYTIYIASTPEKVWEALTSAEFSRKYFFGNSVEVEQRVGGAYVVRTPDGALHISGEVVECDPPRKLTFTFNVNWPALIDKLGPTLVSYEIEQAGDAVKLTMSEQHDRPLSDDILSGGRQGWPAILSSLKSVLETGKPLAVRMAPPARMLAALKELGYRDALIHCRPGQASASERDPGPITTGPRVGQSGKPPALINNDRLGLWVTAFAGTTSEVVLRPAMTSNNHAATGATIRR
jgi:uncharacterized protein YndB with AHSA1/START domain